MTDKELKRYLKSSCIAHNETDRSFVHRVMGQLPTCSKKMRIVWMIRFMAVMVGAVVLVWTIPMDATVLWLRLRIWLSQLTYGGLVPSMETWVTSGVVLSLVTLFICRRLRMV